MTSGLETSDSRIVISSEALKSLSFAFKWSMSGTPKREACYLKPSGIAPLYKNRREASLRLSLPRMGKAGDTGETCHRKLSGIAPRTNPEP